MVAEVYCDSELSALAESLKSVRAECQEKVLCSDRSDSKIVSR